MFLRHLLNIVGILLLTGVFAFPADSTPASSKAETLANIGRTLTVDISRFAMDGDADMARLLDTYQLKGDVDWTARAKDLPKMEAALESLCKELLRLKEQNEHAKAIVEKFNIAQAASKTGPLKSSAPATPAPSRAETLAGVYRHLAEDISRFANDGDAEMAHLLDTHQLKGNVDWIALGQDQQKVENVLQNLCVDLLRLKERNEHARQLVVKFDIRQNGSKPNSPK